MAAGAAFLVKVAHIFATDGSDHTIQGVLYLGGILLGIAGAVGVGARYGSTRLKKFGVGLAAFFGVMFFLTVLSDGVKALINSVADVPEYVATEIPVALLGAVWLVAGYKLWTSNEATGSRAT